MPVFFPKQEIPNLSYQQIRLKRKKLNVVQLCPVTLMNLYTGLWKILLWMHHWSGEAQLKHLLLMFRTSSEVRDVMQAQTKINYLFHYSKQFDAKCSILKT